MWISAEPKPEKPRTAPASAVIAAASQKRGSEKTAAKVAASGRKFTGMLLQWLASCSRDRRDFRCGLRA